MKRTIFLAAILLAAVAQGAALAGATDDGGMVAGSGSGAFPAGATFSGVRLTSLEFGQGVLTDGDTTSGVFHAALLGTSLGLVRTITIDGKVDDVIPGTAPSFSGIANVDLGLGDLSLVNVPFTVTVTAQSIQLTLAGAALPAARLSAGAIAIE